ncbi:HAMP domain-containing sensor histidine kinase [Oculatella sp. FACHB-28]|uniref:sensor histidine kinase n=1 Tax=Oculatella sp. FACHB-28 TaxID=2692845 RepID=UPI0018F0387F|nr:HAMP domain-containing sensor histidine kinase [Oculatella sp. FACHB-28]
MPEDNFQQKNLPEQELLAQLQQTQLAYHMAVEMGQFKAGFLARTSHELRSPLNNIISLHQLILSDLCDSPEEERETIAQAQASASKMLALLDELISIAKVQHGTYEMQIQPLQLADVLEEVHALTHLQIQDRGLRLEIDPPDPETYVLADPRWLRQVLVNLVDPAVSQVMEGSIRLTTQVAPELQQVHIQIQDQRPDHLWSELLNPSQSSPEPEGVSPSTKLPATNSQKPIKPSFGLSLLVNQSLIEKMNGRLEVFTRPAAVSEDAAIAAPLTQIQCSIPWIMPEEDV